jgi:NAD-dependent SIR2 family protein deacetylase
MASTDPNKPHHCLLHVHVCVRCGSAIRREELEGRAHTIGIFVCPRCGTEGPLNLEIREMNESKSGLPEGE